MLEFDIRNRKSHVNILKTGISAIGRLAVVGVLLFSFLAAMAGVVYMSLSGEEITVPEIVGKDFVESEKELAALGLKIKRRADRASSEKINTILEQLPKPGETVKSGQMILVVVSKAGLTEESTPESLKKDIESDDTKKIEEMITDKPKRTRTNTNANANAAKKTADTTRDVIGNTATSTDNSNKKSDADDKPGKTDTDSPKANTTTKQPESPERPRPKQP